MSEWRKIGTALVDAERVRSLIPSWTLGEDGVHVQYVDGADDFIRVKDPKEAIDQFHRAGKCKKCGANAPYKFCGRCGERNE